MYDHTHFLCLQITNQTSGHMLRMVIADGHLILLRCLSGYARVNMACFITPEGLVVRIVSGRILGNLSIQLTIIQGMTQIHFK